MAGSQITILANRIEAGQLGYQAISITHYDDTAEPQIAAGSKVEIGGALFEFTALESITGWGGISNNSDVYIKLVVSGSSVTASFTITAPAWDTAKQGWYSGAERYIFALRKDDSGNYAAKALLLPMPDRQPQGPVAVRAGMDGPFLHVQDQKSSGTGGGTPGSTASFLTRALNTILMNTIPGASLASNQITLPLGSYYLEAWASAYMVNEHKAKVRRITATAADLLIGSSARCQSGGNDTTVSIITGRFTADIGIAIELQHWVSVAAINGWGYPTGAGVVEVYSDVRIWKIA